MKIPPAKAQYVVVIFQGWKQIITSQSVCFHPHTVWPCRKGNVHS